MNKFSLLLSHTKTKQYKINFAICFLFSVIMNVSATDFRNIPVIDISALVRKSDDTNMAGDDGVREVVRELDKACRQIGFFYVKGHGIPIPLLNEVRDMSHKFFELPHEEKLKIKISAATGYRPSNPQHFKLVMEEYIGLCTKLSKTIMRGIALALTGSANSLEGDIAGDPFWSIRMNGYPGISNANALNITKNHVGSGIHTDYGILTLLNQDENINALQVKNRLGEWIWAPPIPGTFMCNIGDMLKILSNGLYESTPHQVTNMTPNYRVSVVYFYEPNYDSTIQPLDICVEKSGGEKKFEAVVYGDHLTAKVRNTFKFEDGGNSTGLIVKKSM
ncbi:probable 2-oxoglutarate-dependent dioxygenase At3g50210 isoform X2 [Beta vulgaris subsp. vulgaris]|uniref:probable 2-oxoglutarate-dependent dioxygenase At3g50210 isoform X2 n=1 Tax=Beta vulgaris subsp. vulgaris TaxID=3555 RepID=UPI002036E522|nr:probable 2-oxoglutarate-dependent dioxygenase At3g50210 isoform X2 [Beta vulgaris subsp. vulgaris]